MKVAWALLRKDLTTELRSRDRLVAMLVFSLLVIIVFQFAWPPMAPAETLRFAPGVLWVTYLFSAVIGLGRTFVTELENDAMTALALAPGTRGWIFLGKASSTWLLISAVQAMTALAFTLFFRVDLSAGAAGSVLVVALANVSICSVGTLLSAMSVRSRFRDVLLPVLL
ncbi:MAG: heme exporter protein CcmB, partial [Myxococcota bacterium]